MICKKCGAPGVLFSRDETGRIELCQKCYSAQTAPQTVRVNLRCGDVVRNKNNGEEWLVAYADYQSGYLAPFGWPEGQCKIAECELVTACTDEQHAKHVAEWLDKPPRRDDGSLDHRVGMVRHLYRPEEERRMVREAIGRECISLADRIDSNRVALCGIDQTVRQEWAIRMAMVLREFARDCGVQAP